MRPSLALVAGAAALLLLAADSPAEASSHTNESGSPLDPRAYARSKRSTLLARYDDAAIAAALDTWAPRLWPGTPRSALVGASASSDGRRGGAPPSTYPVVGWLSVERRYLDTLARDESAVREFGRAIPRAPVGEASTWYTDTEAQTFAGLKRLRTGLAAANRAIPASLQGEPGDPWALRLALAAYSVGAGTLGPLVRAFERDLLRVDPRDRWATLAERVAQACAGASSVAGVECRGLWHAAHALLRIDQRLASGALVASERETSAEPWYDRPISAPVVAALSSMV